MITGYPFESQHYTDDVDAPRLIGGDNMQESELGLIPKGWRWATADELIESSGMRHVYHFPFHTPDAPFPALA